MRIKIGDRFIGENKRSFVVAELSANHNQDFKVALKTLKAIKEAGADAVKIQTYTADTLTIDCDNNFFKIKHGTLWDDKTFYKLYQEAYTPWDWQPKLKKAAEDLGLVFFSTPFDNSAVDFLEKMNVPAYKIASFEITDHALIEYVAKKGKPMILSTGIATLDDIRDAVAVCKKAGNEKVILLKCTSSYPTPYSEINLLTIPDMAQKFKKVIGISDHSEGSAVSVAATAIGAKVIEKHFILDKKIGGPDSAFSMEPEEFARMVRDVRITEQALGKVSYELTEKANKNKVFSRSLFVVEDVLAGGKLTPENVRSIRPGDGLHPKFIKKVMNHRAKKAIKRGTPLNWELID